MRWVFLVAVFLAPAVRAADDRPDRRADPALQKQIDAAIERGVAYLKGAQRRDGSWEHPRGRSATAGLTALAMYALAASRVPAGDKAIVRGLKWTTKHERHYKAGAQYGTYSASLLLLALTRIDTAAHQGRIAVLAERLWRSQLESDMWTYGLVGKRTGVRERPTRAVEGDNSNSQFAVLALWAAHTMARVDVPKETWRRVHDFYRRTQQADGTWAYKLIRGRGRGRPSMTAAGLVSYVYARAALNRGVKSLPFARGTPTARGGRKALFLKPFRFTDFYFVYSLERVGTVLAIPEKDWYFQGAGALVQSQSESGAWQGKTWHGDANHAYETSLALLFLSRATRFLVRPTTRSDSFPDPASPGNLARAFDYYHGYSPKKRAEVLTSFGAAGPAAVAFFVGKLRDKREPTRRTACELLDKLVEKRFFFEPGWRIEDRERMLEPIEEFVRTNRARMRWDEKRRVFVVAR